MSDNNNIWINKLRETGTFKQQHDTGQNLKYLIVYPRVTCSAQGSSSKVEDNSGSDGAAVDTKSPEYIVSACEMTTFKEIVSSKTQSWRQRKRLLKVLQDSSEYFLSIEAKLITGAALTVKEQAAYESNSGESDPPSTWRCKADDFCNRSDFRSTNLDNFISGVDAEKMAWLQGEIKKFVDEGDHILAYLVISSTVHLKSPSHWQLLPFHMSSFYP